MVLDLKVRAQVLHIKGQIQACGNAEKAFKAAFMVSPSHLPDRGMLDATVSA